MIEPEFRHVPPALILPNPTQPRRRFDAESILEQKSNLRSERDEAKAA